MKRNLITHGNGTFAAVLGENVWNIFMNGVRIGYYTEHALALDGSVMLDAPSFRMLANLMDKIKKECTNVV